ncbi:cytochrome C oxidase subunit IV [Flavobacterium branchiophilum NBRC 15030 = ATCC 35035]|uniref:Cytochrome C oxidase subunit IV n=2 Tax=Flavobacterium branchiophilum TaxID=55197 RepID=G2Z2S7_FLABF|nr:cytochrome C oxidase subunit IV family protein [Flavobacterium branchiophilum]OXA77012.1 cytochrome C oxidase subunit IV [Flavobacterium branchiophilum NBRC 15030 = ATCC 35035]PDS23710.1 cytochrome C oxidase subunit IV [Flavobacterium branchiophilum]TQM39525.1 cytochrome c oxidase subunit IV [Flavobacterium branchiophilum]CCB70256.1 Probable transmembrane protein of unknown function [Flavobacterium branchiophilum FL-15]GEM54052.1 cytochrome c oxidase subunit IV [Flavobacterium branchiophilu
MSHAHESNTKRIWTVFIYLSAITIFEVALGLAKPDALYMNNLFHVNILNWIFIILTLVKAYYIVWAFMHMEGEKSSFRWAVVAPVVFLVIYIVALYLIEANYIFEVFKNSTIKWNF